MKQRIKNQLIHNDFGEWTVLVIMGILLIALAVRFAPEVKACLGAAILPEREIIEVYEGQGICEVVALAADESIAALTIRESPERIMADSGAGYEILSPAKNESMDLTANEREAVELAVMSEAGCESYEGQMLVAECIYNAAVHDSIGVFEVFERYQYALRDDVTATESVKEAVAAVFDRGERITNEPIMFFYNPDITSCRWHETLCYVLTEGRHRFFKL